MKINKVGGNLSYSFSRTNKKLWQIRHMALTQEKSNKQKKGTEEKNQKQPHICGPLTNSTGNTSD